MELCGKDTILSAGCERNQILGVEASFANMVIAVATACGDKSKPGHRGLGFITSTCYYFFCSFFLILFQLSAMA